MTIHRGDFVLVVVSGDYGKPRPALVIRADHFEDLPSLTVCPLTTTLRADVPALRIDVSPGEATGLREPSQIAVDKITTVAMAKVGGVIGRADDATMAAIDRAVLVYLGLV